ISNIHAKRVLVFLDCCHAGAGSLQKNSQSYIYKAPDIQQMNVGQGRVLIASSTGEQVSYILKEQTNSLFTLVLLEGLNLPGYVDVFRLFTYIHTEVTKRANLAGVEQTPRIN